MQEALRFQDIYTNRPDRDFDELTQPDERQSQHSTSSKRNSSTESLKAMLREPNPFTISEAIDILEKAGKGLDVSSAQKLAKSARLTIDGMQINLPKTSSSGKGGSISDHSIG